VLGRFTNKERVLCRKIPNLVIITSCNNHHELMNNHHDKIDVHKKNSKDTCSTHNSNISHTFTSYTISHGAQTIWTLTSKRTLSVDTTSSVTRWWILHLRTFVDIW